MKLAHLTSQCEALGEAYSGKYKSSYFHTPLRKTSLGKVVIAVPCHNTPFVHIGIGKSDIIAIILWECVCRIVKKNAHVRLLHIASRCRIYKRSCKSGESVDCVESVSL